jgi:hypothetical protein
LFAGVEILMLSKRHFSYLRRSLASFFLTDVGSTAGSVNGSVRTELAMFMLEATSMSPTSISRWIEIVASDENELSKMTNEQVYNMYLFLDEQGLIEAFF